ncbi:hypothetical protein glysoja_032298 [Glycine soja]|uniref:Uncharacterized protein n=1 Tax=Glycine soja TaxID=3848 RepID=A0A0B2PK62_GLYSO|nr:hypothetical protein glysoja_032298 [Glycine soja]
MWKRLTLEGEMYWVTSVRSPYVVACGPQVYSSNLPNRWIGRGIQSLSSQIDGYQAQKLRKWDVQKVQSIFSPEGSFSYIQGDFWKKLWKIKAIPKCVHLL